MSKKAFDKIAEGLNEALAIAQGTAQAARMVVPAEIDVKAIRTKTEMSQVQFASAFGFTVHQVRQWEQERHRPLGAMRAYLMVIDRNHHEVLGLLRSGMASSRAA
jgi:putative transcriptional regulator